MTVIFHRDAETELNDAADFYEARLPDLGKAFISEVYTTTQRIEKYPLVWPVLADDIRRALLRRFPYGILYAVKQDEIYILAVMHLHRSPEYWKNRISE